MGILNLLRADKWAIANLKRVPSVVALLNDRRSRNKCGKARATHIRKYSKMIVSKP